MRAITVLLTFASLSALAVGLPDTGQTSCSDGRTLVACSSANSGDSAPYPRQDGRFGRDAAATKGASSKIGGGAAGFDYTKVANDGSDLAASALLGNKTSEWACTRDNITGLLWEVKTFASVAPQLRDRSWTYTWYNSNASTNGGNAGTPSSLVAGGGTCLNAGRCDSEKFVTDVNSATLCGFTDWRLPSRRELLTLVHAGSAAPMIDSSYFPNTQSEFFWSSTPSADTSLGVWSVNFQYGSTTANPSSYTSRVRLVRGASF